MRRASSRPHQSSQPPPVAVAAGATASQRWTPDSRRGAAGNEDLRRILRAVAPAGEVVVTLSTEALVSSGALGAWVDDLRTAGVSSFVGKRKERKEGGREASDLPSGVAATRCTVRRKTRRRAEPQADVGHLK